MWEWYAKKYANKVVMMHESKSQCLAKSHPYIRRCGHEHRRCGRRYILSIYYVVEPFVHMEKDSNLRHRHLVSKQSTVQITVIQKFNIFQLLVQDYSD